MIGECPKAYGACHARSSIRHLATGECLLTIPDIQFHAQGTYLAGNIGQNASDAKITVSIYTWDVKSLREHSSA